MDVHFHDHREIRNTRRTDAELRKGYADPAWSCSKETTMKHISLRRTRERRNIEVSVY
jgi:hypothetical protein